MQKKEGDLLGILILCLVVVIFTSSTLAATSNSSNLTIQNNTNASSITPNITTPSTPKVNFSFINLKFSTTKDKYTLNSALQPTITLMLNETIGPNETITLEIQGYNKTTLTLAQLLKNASISYKVSKSKPKKSNPQVSKTLTFDKAGVKKIAMSLPKNADVNSVTMDISGPSGNKLFFPRIDVRDDGSIDWFYLGSFVQWKGNYTIPKGLDETSLSTVEIVDNKSYYCQEINVPLTKDIQVFAKIKKLASGGNLKAIRLSILTSSQASGQTDICDFPESSTLEWQNCTLNFKKSAISGKQLICVYSDGQKDGTTAMYELARDLKSDTSIICNYLAAGIFDCKTKTQFSDPLIKIKTGNYSLTLDKAVDYKSWEAFSNATLLAFKVHFGSGNYKTQCTTNPCTIPISIQANGSGTVMISNAKIRYKYQGYTSTEKSIYDFMAPKPMIVDVGGSNLSKNTTIVSKTIPLSAFGTFKALNFYNISNITYFPATAKITFKGVSSIAGFRVYLGSTIPKEGTELLISQYKKHLNNLTVFASTAEKAILKSLGLDTKISSAITQLATYETQLKSGKSEDTIKKSLNATINVLPVSVQVGTKASDTQVIEPNDITSSIAGTFKKADVYQSQNKVDVTSIITPYAIMYFDGKVKKGVMVSKTLTAKKSLSKIDVFEWISSSVVTSASQIHFEETPKPVSGTLNKWYLPSLSSGSSKTYNYLLDTTSSVYHAGVKTIIVETSPVKSRIVAPKAVCGDGKCTKPLEDKTLCPKDCKVKLPWGVIIIALVVLIPLIGYVAFYRGKYSLGKLLGMKKPFTTPEDLEAVKKYIKSSRVKGNLDGEIKGFLIEKGWTQKQVDFAFTDLLWEKAPKPVKKLKERGEVGEGQVDPEPMKKYIKDAREKGLRDQEIKKTLLDAGWDAGLVEEELDRGIPGEGKEKGKETKESPKEENSK